MALLRDHDGLGLNAAQSKPERLPPCETALVRKPNTVHLLDYEARLIMNALACVKVVTKLMNLYPHRFELLRTSGP